MRLDSDSLAQLIDISAVQAAHGLKEVRELAGLAQEHRFKAAHVLPCWVKTLHELMGEGASTLVGAPVGFPGGGHTTATKLVEAKGLIEDGVDEMDIMLNVGRHRSGDYGYVENELREIVAVAHGEGIPTKVILEVHYLTPDEIRKACEICIRAESDFVKTSTGWAPTGATFEIVELITTFVGDAIQIKAAGGIRTLATMIRMYEMGVRRFGINTRAALSILDECSRLPDDAVELRDTQ